MVFVSLAEVTQRTLYSQKCHRSYLSRIREAPLVDEEEREMRRYFLESPAIGAIRLGLDGTFTDGHCQDGIKTRYVA
jgi:hypothetical protein